MGHDWNSLCAEDAVRCIMLSALAEEVDKLHLSRDSEGSTLYFLTGQDMHIFDRLPAGIDERVCEFFMQLAGIERWESPEAASGYGLYVLGGMDITLVVNVMRGSQGYDLIIIPEIFHRNH